MGHEAVSHETEQGTPIMGAPAPYPDGTPLLLEGEGLGERVRRGYVGLPLLFYSDSFDLDVGILWEGGNSEG